MTRILGRSPVIEARLRHAKYLADGLQSVSVDHFVKAAERSHSPARHLSTARKTLSRFIGDVGAVAAAFAEVRAVAAAKLEELGDGDAR